MPPRFLPSRDSRYAADWKYHRENNSLRLMQLWATFFGGEFLSKTARGFSKEYLWRCGLGHEFRRSPNYILENGWLCPTCYTDDCRSRLTRRGRPRKKSRAASKSTRP